MFILILIYFHKIKKKYMYPLDIQQGFSLVLHWFSISFVYNCRKDIYVQQNRLSEERTLGAQQSYRVFIKYCVFSLKFSYFSELCQFCCSTGVLPACCVYTHWQREKTESRKYIKIFEKTQYLINTLEMSQWPPCQKKCVSFKVLFDLIPIIVNDYANIRIF